MENKPVSKSFPDPDQQTLWEKTKEGFRDMWDQITKTFSGAYTHLIETDIPDLQRAAGETMNEMRRFNTTGTPQPRPATTNKGDSAEDPLLP